MIAVAHSFGPHTARVRPRLRLCQSETGNQIPRRNARQPFRLLGFVAMKYQGLRPDPDIRACHRPERRRGPAELQRNEALGFHIKIQPAILLGHGQPEQAKRLHLLDNALRHLIALANLRFQRHTFLAYKPPNGSNQLGAKFCIKSHIGSPRSFRPV